MQLPLMQFKLSYGHWEPLQSWLLCAFDQLGTSLRATFRSGVRKRYRPPCPFPALKSPISSTASGFTTTLALLLIGHYFQVFFAVSQEYICLYIFSLYIQTYKYIYSCVYINTYMFICVYINTCVYIEYIYMLISLQFGLCYVLLSHFGYLKLVLQYFSGRAHGGNIPELLRVCSSMCSFYQKVSFAGYKLLGSCFHFLEYLKYITLISFGIKHCC